VYYILIVQKPIYLFVLIEKWLLKSIRTKRERFTFYWVLKFFLDSNPYSRKKSFLCLSDYFFPVSFTSFGQLWTERQKRNKKRERLKKGVAISVWEKLFSKRKKREMGALYLLHSSKVYLLLEKQYGGFFFE
jgi:hypothetical protein